MGHGNGPNVLPEAMTDQIEEGLWTVHVITKWVNGDIHVRKVIHIEHAR